MIRCVTNNVQREKTLNIGEITIIGNDNDNAQIEANMKAVYAIINDETVGSIVPQRELELAA